MNIDMLWDESPVDVTAEANFIWSIANELRGSYMPDKYGDVIIPMVIIRRFEDALIEGLNQNQDFFSLLLGNDEIKKEVLGIFAEEIYRRLRAGE